MVFVKADLVSITMLCLFNLLSKGELLSELISILSEIYLKYCFLTQ